MMSAKSAPWLVAAAISRSVEVGVPQLASDSAASSFFSSSLLFSA
jgi:hypothetical protein